MKLTRTRILPVRATLSDEQVRTIKTALTCRHKWEYDTQESEGPWTGYIERCVKCGALLQVPM